MINLARAQTLTSVILISQLSVPFSYDSQISCTWKSFLVLKYAWENLNFPHSWQTDCCTCKTMIIVIALFVLSKLINATHYQSYRTHQVLILGFTKTNFNSKLISQDINEHEKWEDSNLNPPCLESSRKCIHYHITQGTCILLIHVFDIKSKY